MTCVDIRGRLDDWAAGRLDEFEAAAITEHLVGCESCRDDARRSLELARATAQLPRGIAPPRDPWPGIVGRLGTAQRFGTAEHPRPSRFRLRTPALAAAAIALVLVTATVTTLFHRGWDNAMARKLKGPAEAPVAADAIRAAPAADGATTEELLAAFEGRDLDPETMAIVQRNLAVIDGAIAELEEALDRDPRNEELARMLVSTYRKRAELIESAVRAVDEG